MTTFASDSIPSDVPIWALLTIKLSREAIERCLGVRFEKNHDDLDEYHSLLLKHNKKTTFLFKQYKNEKNSEITIYVNKQEDYEATLTIILALLGVTEDAVAWRNPEFLRKLQ
jgi:hypothetical protein